MVLALLEIYLLLAACLIYIGYGVTSLLLPTCLWRWRLLVMPFLGYAVVVLLFAGLNTYLLTGQQITVVLLATATALNILSLIKRRHTQTDLPWKESLIPVLLSLAVYAVAVIPLVSYGTLTVIGTNGDVEQYLGSAEYVRQFSFPAMSAAPPNPLQSLTLWVVSDPLGNMGFSYVLSLVTVLLRWSAVEAFAPTLAFFVSANVIAAYLFARVTLGASSRASALAGLILGMNSLVLWACFFNYGRQIASLSLLPLGAIAFASCLEELKPRSVLLATALLAAMVLTYWPAAAFLIASVGLFAILSISRELRAPSKGKLLGIGAATVCILAIGILPLAANLLELSRLMFGVWRDTERGTVAAFVQGWLSNLTGARIVSPLPDSFLPIDHVFGLSYYVWPQPESAVERFGPLMRPVFNQVGPVVVILALCLSMYGLWHATRTGRYMATSLAIIAVLQLGGVQFLSHNTYYYFKTLTFSAFVGTTLMVLGLTRLWQIVNARQGQAWRRWGTGALGLIGLILLLMNGANTYSTVRHFVDRPQSSFVSPYLDVAEINRLIEPNASICLSDDVTLQQAPMGVIALALMGHPLYGDTQTQESLLDNALLQDPEERYFVVKGRDVGGERYPCAYALLAAQEDPTEKGYFSQDLIWANTMAKVYRRGVTLARLEFAGQQRGEVTPTEPLDLLVHRPAHETSLADNSASGISKASEGSLVFRFGSLVDQRLSIEVNGEKMEEQITAGLWQYQTGAIQLPATVRLSSNGDEPLLVSWVQLMESSDSVASLTRLKNAVVLRSGSATQDGRFVTRVRWLGPTSSSVPGWIELRVRGASIPNDASLITTWPLGATIGETEIALDRTTKEITAAQPSLPSGVAHWSPREGQPQSFTTEIRVVFANIAETTDRQQVMPLFDVKRQADGAIDATPFEHWFLYKRFADAPWQPMDTLFGGTVRLIGYTLEGQSARPGDDARLSLYWQVPMGFSQDWRVFAHLVDAQGQAWGQHDLDLLSAQRFQIGSSTEEIWRQDHAITVGPRAPTGRYFIEVGLYQPDTLKRLTAVGKGVRDGDTLVTDWVKVTGAETSLSGASFDPRYPADVDMGGLVRLLGFDVRPSTLRSGESFELTLYWQATSDRQIGRNYTVFVHLLDLQNRVRLGQDEQPLRGRYPTSIWSPGETVADQHTINLDQIAAGEYQIEVGLYSLDTGERLPIMSDTQPGEDRILLGFLQVQSR